jgi:hypothetical protein
MLSTQRETAYATHQSDGKTLDVNLLKQNNHKAMWTGQKNSVKTSGRSRYPKKHSRPRSAKSGKSSRSHKSREGNVRGGGHTQEY